MYTTGVEQLVRLFSRIETIPGVNNVFRGMKNKYIYIRRKINAPKKLYVHKKIKKVRNRAVKSFTKRVKNAIDALEDIP